MNKKFFTWKEAMDLREVKVCAQKKRPCPKFGKFIL